MKKVRADWERLSKRKNIGYGLLGFTALIVLVSLLHAQTTFFGGGNVPVQSQQNDTVVSVVADEMGLPLVPPDQVPRNGTFWTFIPGLGNGLTPPFPCLISSNLPVYAIADGQFLVDGTSTVQPTSTTMRTGLMASSTSAAQTITTQANSLVNLVNWLQGLQDEQELRMMAEAAGMDLPSLPGDGGGSGDGGSGGGINLSIQIDTNGLWLGNPVVSNGVTYVNLNNATNQVYAILTKTNLLDASWTIEQVIWPTNGTVVPTVTPLAVQNSGRQILFFRVEDWTGVTENGNTTPDWWLWQYFGTTALSDTNLDANGNTLANDYSNNIAPMVFSFNGIEVANNNVNTSLMPMQLDVTGSPYYIAVLVDDTNFNNASWDSYVSPNLTVSLGLTEGWHEVWIGLRAHSDEASAAIWKYKRLKLDFTPPTLVVTSPTGGTVDVPVIQLTGFSPEALSSISYDITNTSGIFSNQQVLITGQFCSTNTWEFTTNFFEGVDVPLTNGVNQFTLRATDLAGNTTTTNFSLTLDYSGKTNPPVIQLDWPQDGMVFCGNQIVCRGSISDPTATITAIMVDTNNATNTFNALVGRDGTFAIDSLPLGGGSNLLTLRVVDVVGNVTITNHTVLQGDAGLTIDPVAAGQTTITGSIVSTDCTIWVNGIQATLSGNTWEADNVPTRPNGLVKVTAVPNGGGL